MTSEQSLSAEAIESKSCPFCGGVVILDAVDSGFDVEDGTLLCDDCHAMAPADVWNHRALTRPALSEERIREIAAGVIGQNTAVDAIRQALREQSQQESRHE